MGQKSKGNSVYRHTAFKIKPNANITYNQKQIPGSTCTLGRWRFYFCSHRSQNYFPASPCYFVFVFFLRLFTHSQCIHNWPVTQEISNYFKFCRVWPVRWCMLHGRPCLELTPGKFNGSDLKVSLLPPPLVAVDVAYPLYSACLFSVFTHVRKQK